MNIIFYVYRYWPKIGGVEKYIHELALALTARGHTVSVVTGSHDNALSESETRDGVTIHRYPALRSPMRCQVHLLRMRQMFADADVIHISDIMMLEHYRRMIGWTLPDKPVFLTRHGMSIEHPVPSRDKKRAARAAKYATAVIDDGHFISKWLESPADAVIAQGLSPAADEIEPVEPTAKLGATFVGRLEWDTGIDAYLDALHILKTEHNKTVPLDVVGHGSLRTELELRANKDKLPIRFLGQRPDAQDHLLPNPVAFVSGRLAIHEALARRRPVIAHYVNPVKRDYLADEPFSPHIMIAANGREIAQAVMTTIENPKQTREMINAGYAYTRQLSWDRTADAYLDIWQEHVADAESRLTLSVTTG